MTRARPAPSLQTTLRGIFTRLIALERARRDTISPISTAAATINQTAAQTPFMALVNPTGASMTWWIQVTPTVGTNTSLQLRSDGGTVGAVVIAPNGTTSIVGVSLTCPPDWKAGTQVMIYLDAWIDVNSATVVPVSARFN